MNHEPSSKANTAVNGLPHRFEKTANMEISLQSLCMRANATLLAMDKYPQDFTQIKSWIVVQPFNARTMIEKSFEIMGIDIEEMENFENKYRMATGFRLDDHDMRKCIKSVSIPTLMVQVCNDMSNRESDIQEMYDNLSVEDKKMLWIEDTPLRFHGYTYFSEHPEEMIEWFDAHMC